MKSLGFLLGCLPFASVIYGTDSNLSEPLSSHQILPRNFRPPPVFKNVNLVRNINLEKGYVKETVNVVIQNTDANSQDEYYIPFKASIIGKVGGLEVRDKKNPETSPFKSEVVEYDVFSPTQFYRITLPKPLETSGQQTLTISYHLLSALAPLPAEIKQQDKQYLLHTFSSYTPSVYLTTKQKTKLKLPTTDIPDFTGEPERQGSSFTYGPYENIPTGVEQEASVRYEFTKPIIHTTLLERDIEVSHWGGNIAFEERYWLTNKAASLINHFSRVTWASTQYYNPPSSAIKEFKVPLRVGSLNPYFTDEIGNISTSRFRSNSREANLELKPRYPVFGGWNFPFRIGWDANLKDFLRKATTGEGYVLKVPFLEGPKMNEGISYEKVELRVILPEGAINVKYSTSIPILTATTTSHNTFMDTLGRTSLKLTAMNVIDESRDTDLTVTLPCFPSLNFVMLIQDKQITYDYPFLASFRKPIIIFVSVLGVFVTAWVLSKIDTSIGKKS
ncbi:dolichyl-diphosphooligosaccharide--protein glycosyltransferase subunit 1 [Varicellaria rhodocarpa]|nr:dolichyl-diphosphooligosaccharide--protein glycosyltransferase subunit 1 [Varicellaria rhodocarpa]